LTRTRVAASCHLFTRSPQSKLCRAPAATGRFLVAHDSPAEEMSPCNRIRNRGPCRSKTFPRGGFLCPSYPVVSPSISTGCNDVPPGVEISGPETRKFRSVVRPCRCGKSVRDMRPRAPYPCQESPEFRVFGPLSDSLSGEPEKLFFPARNRRGGRFSMPPLRGAGGGPDCVSTSAFDPGPSSPYDPLAERVSGRKVGGRPGAAHLSTSPMVLGPEQRPPNWSRSAEHRDCPRPRYCHESAVPQRLPGILPISGRQARETTTPNFWREASAA